MDGGDQRVSSLTDRKNELDRLVVGWMTPVLYRDDPATGRRLNGLGPKDFQRVMAGYGCPDCLAKFATYLSKCPVCSFQRDVAADVEAPPSEWVDWLAEDDGPAGIPLSVDEFLSEVARDPDIEQRRL
jgi:hypothetical protein